MRLIDSPGIYKLEIKYNEKNTILMDSVLGNKESVVQYLRNISSENIEKIIFEKVKKDL